MRGHQLSELEGTIAGVNVNQRGTGFLLEGRPEGEWFNFGKILPRGAASGLAVKQPPIGKEDRGKSVRFSFTTNDKGFNNIEVNMDGSHALEILNGATALGTSGATVIPYDPEAKERAILWSVCLKLAGDVCIANARRNAEAGDPGHIMPDDVLNMAQALFQGGPGDDKHETLADPAREATAQVLSGRVDEPPDYDGDPGPQEP